jgi:hypothetical protein
LDFGLHLLRHSAMELTAAIAAFHTNHRWKNSAAIFN